MVVFRPVFILCICFFPFLAFAGKPGPVFRQYTTADGLPSNYINSIYQDPNGFLWISTDKGIAQFDGHSFTIYNTDHGLPENMVYASAMDADGVLWIGMYGKGLCRMKNGIIEQAAEEADMGSVVELQTDGYGRVYAKLSKIEGKKIRFYVCIWDKKRWTYYPTRYASERDNFARLDNGDILTFVGRQLYRLHPSDAAVSWHPIALEKKHPDLLRPKKDWGGHGCLLLAKDTQRQAVWFGHTYSGMADFANDSIRLHVEEAKWPTLWGLAFFDGHLLLAGENGLLLYDENIPVEVPNQFIHDVYEGQGGELWLGTYGGGLLKSMGRHLALVSSNEPDVKAMLFDGDGNLLLGSSKGVAVYDAEGKLLAKNERVKNVLHLYRHENGEVWVCNFLGIYVYRNTEALIANETPTFIRVASGISGIYTDYKGQHWIGTYGNAVNIVPAGATSFTAHTDKMGIGGYMTEGIFPSSLGLWATTSSEGAYLLNEGKEAVRITKQDGLASNTVHHAFEEKNGSVRIATEHGLSLYENGSVVQTLSYQQGLEGRRIMYVFSHRGELYALSNKYLHHVGKYHLYPLCHAPLLPNFEEDIQRAYYRNGKLAIATATKVLEIDMDKLPNMAYRPRIVLKGMYASDTVPLPLEATAVDAGATSVKYCYAMLGFAEENANKASFFLEGYSDYWTQPSHKASVSFYGLRPGKYTLKVRLYSLDGSSAEEFSLHEFELLSFWWQRTWFIALATMALVGAIGGIAWLLLRRRYRQKVKALEMQHRIQLERERISRDLHDNVGAQLAFIVNKLEKANHTVPSKEVEEAHAFAKESIRHLRESIWVLRQAEVPIGEWLSRLRQLVHQWQDLGEADYAFEADAAYFGLESHLPPSAAINLYRIAQEALHNSAKYSRATKIRVSVAIAQGLLTLCISDNGEGFVPGEKKGYGLQNMEARAREVGAKWSLASSPGVKICVELPL